MKQIGILIVVLTFLGLIAAALYVGGWLLFIGGIVQAIESAKVQPINSLGIAIGIVRVAVAVPVGWGVFAVGGFIFAALALGK